MCSAQPPCESALPCDNSRAFYFFLHDTVLPHLMNIAARSFKPSPQVLCQTVAGEAVLLDLASEQYFGLDEVGARIWGLLGEHGNLDSIQQVLVAEFEAEPEQIARDLHNLVQKLLDAGLVVADDASAPAAP